MMQQMLASFAKYERDLAKLRMHFGEHTIKPSVTFS